ncbi:MAG: sigma factor, partial [Stellaceae bacterium]
MAETDDGTRRAVERAARDSYGRLVAYLAARSGDVAGAEDALSEAFAAALSSWQAEGVPRAPEAWLLAVARRKAIDQTRRRRTHHDAGDVLRILADEISERDTADKDIP